MYNLVRNAEMGSTYYSWSRARQAWSVSPSRSPPVPRDRNPERSRCMIIVVAALIEQNGRLLVCQRRRGDVFPLKWEFPGGKVRPGESAAHALVRELAEELGVTARIGREVYRTRHRYAEQSDELELVFFSAALDAQAPQNLAFESIEWAAPAALPGYDFLPADRELIALLASGALRLP